MNDIFISLPFRLYDKEPNWKVLENFISTVPNFVRDDVIEKIKTAQSHFAAIYSTLESNTLNHTKQFADEFLGGYAATIYFLQHYFPLSWHNIKTLTYQHIDSSIKVKESSNNATVEYLTCYLNAASIYAKVAIQNIKENDSEEMKKCFQLFQEAAGLYQFILDALPYIIDNKNGDFSSKTIKCYLNYTLAQAQHCSYIKAVCDFPENHILLSKLAMETSCAYSSAIPNKNNEPLYTQIFSLYSQQVTLLFKALAYIHLARSEKKIGVAISLFQAALSELAVLKNKYQKYMAHTILPWFNSVEQVGNSEKNNLVTLNNTVYFYPIPKEAPVPSRVGRLLGTPILPNKFKPVKLLQTGQIEVQAVSSHIREQALYCRSEMMNNIDLLRSKVSSCKETVLCILGEAKLSLTGNSYVSFISINLRRKINLARNNSDGLQTLIIACLINDIKNNTELCTSLNSCIVSMSECVQHIHKVNEECILKYGEEQWKERLRDSNSIQLAFNFGKNINELRNKHSNFKSMVEELNHSTKSNLANLSLLDLTWEEIESKIEAIYEKEKCERSMVSCTEVLEIKQIAVDLEMNNEQLSNQLYEIEILFNESTILSHIIQLYPTKYKPLFSQFIELQKEKAGQVEIIIDKQFELVKKYEELSNRLALKASELESTNPICLFVSQLQSALLVYNEINDKSYKVKTDLSIVCAEAKTLQSRIEKLKDNACEEFNIYSKGIEAKLNMKEDILRIERNIEKEIKIESNMSKG